ncbi:4,5-DOPA dioxygenase extradiol [Sporocytophaga myxococcoides]|uniref:4,5-DOPA-extradiol-dioxygenase n=1 Tax=Sporocytophaga myxococcoides TaxID=153721 RepID=UPI00048ECABF|nr:4,5-DOPA dioxygenase extradiol [Sporocytophaga myxococcoides]
MNRTDFLKILALMPFAGGAVNLKELNKLTSEFEPTETMPVLFLGHGSPMNALQQNEFSKGWQDTGKSLPTPKAILCISAHWETKGTFVTAMTKPKTIHDFGGFPRELHEFQYPAPGSPELAEEVKGIVRKTSVQLDHNWGLDHGSWSVIAHLYPGANIPVIQMSMDYTKDPLWHYELAKELSVLRQKGILIMGSGNIVHNLHRADWNTQGGFDWAIEANEKVKKLILENNHNSLVNYHLLGKEVQLAVPSPEHYMPLLYALGLKQDKETPVLFNDKTELGSISMTSVKLSN